MYVRMYVYVCKCVCARACTCSDADKEEVVFVPNATVGNNAVIQSVVRTLKKGDSILMLSLAYGNHTHSHITYVRMYLAYGNYIHTYIHTYLHLSKMFAAYSLNNAPYLISFCVL